MLALLYLLHARTLVWPTVRRDESGQAMAEYALVLLGAAAIALAVGSWVSRSDFVGRLLDTVFNGLLGKANQG